MSAIKDCEYEIQSIVDTMSSEIQFTLEHGFEKMQNNSNFKKWILDLEERIKQDNPPQFVASQSWYYLSIFDLSSIDYGLPERFDEFEDFMAFVYGVAKTFSINAVSVTYIKKSITDEYTEEFQTLSSFLEWTKNQFEFDVHIYKDKSCKEYARFGLNDPIKYRGGFLLYSGETEKSIISSAKTKYYGILDGIRGVINLYRPCIEPHTVTFYRIPPTKKETNNKPASWY